VKFAENQQSPIRWSNLIFDL